MKSRLTDVISPLRQMVIMAAQYLNGRKLRTLLTTLAIVIGVALIFAINLILPSMLETFQKTMQAASGEVDLNISNVTGEAFSPEGSLATVTGVQDVKAATGTLRRNILLPGEASGAKGTVGSAPQLELIGLDPATAQAVRPYVVTEGRFLEPSDSGKVVLPTGIAEIAPQLKVGATFPLITSGGLRLYTVVGLLAEKVNSSAPQLYVTLGDAQSALKQPGMISGIEVVFAPGADRDAVTANIQKALGSAYRMTASLGLAASLPSLDIGYAIANMMGLLAMFLGAFLIFNTFRTIVIERRRDLALLRAIGASRRQVTQMILVESLVQGVVGTAIGLVFGYLLTSGMSRFMGKLFQQAGFLAGFQIQVNPTLPQLVSAAIGPVFLGVLITVAAGYWPARAAGRTSPLAALRPETTSAAQRIARRGFVVGLVIMALAVLLLLSGAKGAAAGALLFLVGIVLAAPGLVMPAARLFSPLLTLWFAREGDLARGNLTRQPGRAAITGGTLMIGLASLIMIAALVSSFNYMLTSLLNNNFASDIMLVPQTVSVYNNVVGADEQLAEKLRALPQVDLVAGLRYATSDFNGKGLTIYGIDPVAYPKVAPLEFAAGNPNQAYTELGAGRTVIVNSLTSKALALDVGSEFTLQTVEGPQKYHVVGVGNDMLGFKLNALYISQASMKADFHKTEDVMLMLNLKPGSDKTAVLKDVEKILADYPQFTARISGEYRASFQDLISSALQLFYLLAALILFPAVLGLLNTLTINVLERTREIGVVRAVGGSRKQVRRIVTAEALLLGLFGAAMGVLAGVAMSYGFIMAFSTFGWKMPYEFPFIGIVAAIVVGVLLALFAAILPARSASRLDIIRALQYE